MSTVNGKYLKDENSNIISPIVSTDTIYDTSGNPMGGGVLYQLVRYYHMLVKLLRQII